MTAERKNAHNENDIKDCFYKFPAIIKEYGITTMDTWNMDEIVFRVGFGKARIVVTLAPERPVLITDPDNRDYIT